MDGMMGLGPTVAMASKAQRSGKMFTEVYADYVRLHDDYARNVAQIEDGVRFNFSFLCPSAGLCLNIGFFRRLSSQQCIEYERLQSDQLASQLSQALADRDGQATVAQEISSEVPKERAREPAPSKAVVVRSNTY
jgi:nucleoprotein TPR